MLDRALAIFDAFMPNGGVLSLSELTERTGLPKATVHRIAQRLVRWGGLERNASGYRIGLRLFDLAQLVPRQSDLRIASQRYLQDIHRRTGHSAQVVVVDAGSARVLSTVEGVGPPSPLKTNSRSSLHLSAAGRALLAFFTEDRREQVLAGELVRATRYTATSPDILRKMVGQVRSELMAFELEEHTIGWGSVAAPLIGRPLYSVVGALSISYKASGRESAQRLAAVLADSAHALSRELTGMRVVHSPTIELAS